MSVYQHKWYKYSLSFLALISTTNPPPSVPLIKLIALQTLYKQPLSTIAQTALLFSVCVFLSLFSIIAGDAHTVQ